MRNTLLVFTVTAALAAGMSSAPAAVDPLRIQNSMHDLAAKNWGTDELCKYCAAINCITFLPLILQMPRSPLNVDIYEYCIKNAFSALHQRGGVKNGN